MVQTTYNCKWVNDENISGLSSVYQTQSGLDSAVSGLAYQKLADVNNSISALSSVYQRQDGLDASVGDAGFVKTADITSAITALNLSSTYQSQSGLNTAVTSVITGLSLQTQAGLDGAVNSLGYVKTSGADATKAGNVYSALASFFTMLNSASEIKDGSGNPYDFTSLLATLNA
ncbi:MAG: hypothetical protein P4L35_07780 [Ignavibacteriaceae bacterium]|nr:hypothetical protein [Ignavibacteriaceae bacterium]